jgi:serine/threonine protein phosphatase 1
MSLLKHNRTIVVGDLHGCYDELIELLSKIGFTADDRLITVGDLAVKGPKCKELLDLFISDDRFSSVLGNHDAALLRLLRRQKFKSTRAQRAAAVELYGEREKYSSFFASLPLIADLGSHVVVHAGLRPGIPLAQQDPADLLELRTLGQRKRTSHKGIPWYEVYYGEKVALFGHWPADEPRQGPRALGLDTGCVYGHRLTGYILETRELVSVPSRFTYRPRWGLYKSISGFMARFLPGA